MTNGSEYTDNVLICSWSATTGRPSVIPNAYLTHCDILLSFYDASILDGMLIAEVGLYKALLQKLDDPTHPRIDDDESIGFTLWKQQWNHLLSEFKLVPARHLRSYSG